MKQIDETIIREIEKRRAAPEPSHNMLSLLMHAKYEDGTGMTDNKSVTNF